MPGARIRWLGGGGIKRIIPRIRKRGPKKRSLSQKMREFLRTPVWNHKKKESLFQNLQKTVLAHEFWGDNQFFGSLRSRTALQWHQACYFLWGAFSLGVHKQWFGGARPRKAPCGVEPAASLQQFIELQLSHFRLRDIARNRLCWRSENYIR